LLAKYRRYYIVKYVKYHGVQMKLKTCLSIFLSGFFFLLPAANVTNATTSEERASGPVLHFRDDRNKEYLDIGINLFSMTGNKLLIGIWVKNQGDKEKSIALSKISLSCIAFKNSSEPQRPDEFGPPIPYTLINETVKLQKGNTYERKTTISLPESWKDKPLGFVLSYNKARIHFTFDGKNMQIKEELPPSK